MKQTILLFFSFCISMSIKAQISGSLDPTFGSNGKVITSFARGHDQAHAVLVQADGKIVSAGLSVPDSNAYRQHMALARHNTDGTLDNTFGRNGKVTTVFGVSSAIQAITLQNDGKIIAAGYTSDSTAESRFAVVRYWPSGVLDTTFGDKGRVSTNFGPYSSWASAIMVQPDGKILVGGIHYTFAAFNFNGLVALARYTTAGVLDSTFNATGKIIQDVHKQYADLPKSIALQADNKIVICGDSESPFNNGIDVWDPLDMFIMRYNTNGSLDSSFNNKGILTEEETQACVVKILDSGKLLVAGNTDQRTHNFQLRRFNSNGSIDATFNFDAPTYGTATDMLVQRDGKIILVGTGYNPTTYQSNFTLFRCHADGNLDNAFGTNGKVITQLPLLYEYYGKIAQQNDGKILACGYSKIGSQFHFNLIRYNNTFGNVATKAIATAITPLMVYPNPMSNTVTIALKEASLTTNASLRVRIVDVAGRVVLSNNFDSQLINDKLTLDVTGLITGSYILEVTSGDKHWTRLLSKQ